MPVGEARPAYLFSWWPPLLRLGLVAGSLFLPKLVYDRVPGRLARKGRRSKPLRPVDPRNGACIVGWPRAFLAAQNGGEKKRKKPPPRTEIPRKRCDLRESAGSCSLRFPVPEVRCKEETFFFDLSERADDGPSRVCFVRRPNRGAALVFPRFRSLRALSLTHDRFLFAKVTLA